MSPPIRAALVTHQYPTDAEPSRGASLYQQFEEFKKLADLSVFCVMPEYPKTRLLQPRTFQYRRATHLYPDPSVKGAIVRYFSLPWITRPINGRNCARKLLPYLRQANPEIILASFLYPDGYAAVVCGRELGIPVVVEGIGSDLRRVYGYWARRWTRETVQGADFLITVSSELRTRAVRDFGADATRVRVIRRGINPNLFQVGSRSAARNRLSIAQDAELIVFVGRLVGVKGLRELIESFRRLSSVRPHALLACIGEGPLLSELQTIVHGSDLSGRVRFVGSLQPAEVAEWMVASQLVCLPSHSEGLPNVVLEALACGRPVVASDVGGIPEVIGPDCGLLVPAKSPQRLAGALDECLSQKWDEVIISLQFRRSWEEAAKEQLKLCGEVLSHVGPKHRRLPPEEREDAVPLRAS